jgi:hypothetical protein
MKISKVKFTVTIVAATATYCLSSVVQWDPGRKPSMAIETALELVRKKIKDNDIFYCVSAHLLEDSDKGDAKRSVWTIVYGATDGRERAISVTSEGDCKVTSEKKKTQAGLIASLDEALLRVTVLLEKSNMPFTVKNEKGSVLIESNSREYMLYESSEDGRFKDKLSRFTGPQANGFEIKIELQNTKSTINSHTRGPYWISDNIPFLSKDKNMKYQLSAKWGVDFFNTSGLLVEEIISAMGEVYDTFSTPLEE